MATKGKPFTMRLRRDFEELLEMEARRSRRSKAQVLEALADEALRMRRFPGIGFMGAEHDRRAYLQGTGLDVWEVMELVRDYGEDRRELMFEAHPIAERQLEVVLAYYREYPEEIDWHIEENSRSPEEWHRLYPGVATTPPED